MSDYNKGGVLPTHSDGVKAHLVEGEYVITAEAGRRWIEEQYGDDTR